MYQSEPLGPKLVGSEVAVPGICQPTGASTQDPISECHSESDLGSIWVQDGHRTNLNNRDDGFATEEGTTRNHV